jgi:hypothetical protein
MHDLRQRHCPNTRHDICCEVSEIAARSGADGFWHVGDYRARDDRRGAELVFMERRLGMACYRELPRRALSSRNLSSRMIALLRMW